MENNIFTVFFIIERWFFKGIHRKNKKVKTVFASILIPKYVFSKTKMQNIINHRIQFIMKIMIFRKIEKSCNTKTLWKQFWEFCFFGVSIQKHLYNATSESLEKAEKSLWTCQKNWKIVVTCQKKTEKIVKTWFLRNLC